ncbi:hypothetical protein WN944_006153 [Citrus x changshan-huyou]|uniref:Uncharacterized protein n=1 Tax=Citrus x changshan-huyou TaxID=2935761 RepID=A0AAP0MQ38_9ROSI
MDKFLKDFRVDIKSATRGGRRKMRAAVAEMKKRHDKLLKKTKLNKRSRSQVIEGSGSSTNESDGTHSDVGSSPSSIYLSINAEEDDDIDLKPTEPHIEDDLRIKTERENAFGDIEDPKADLKRDHPTRKDAFLIVQFVHTTSDSVIGWVIRLHIICSIMDLA